MLLKIHPRIPSISKRYNHLVISEFHPGRTGLYLLVPGLLSPFLDHISVHPRCNVLFKLLLKQSIHKI